MAQELNDMHEKEHALDLRMAIDEKPKTTRHPRWTKEDLLVLIHCKKVVEHHIRECQSGRSISASGSEQNEPKWDSVSSYCKQHGVYRTPAQCQKRWSNLFVDFKKIKTWELQIKEEAESFWIMKHDLRKEMKLPTFFEREVYDVLDSGDSVVTAIPLSVVTNTTSTKKFMAVVDKEKGEAEVVFDSSQRRRDTVEDGLFSDIEPSGKEEIDQSPEKETIARESPTKTVSSPRHISDKVKKRSPGSNEWTGSTSQERSKHRRFSLNVNENTNIGERLIKELERNSNMLNAQLEAQNINFQQDREQRKEHSDSLVAAVNKLTDELVRIADKYERS